MSTPANIIVLNENNFNFEVNKKLSKEFLNYLENQITLYIHSDGDDCFNWLKEFLKLDGSISRKHHKEYLINWLSTYYNVVEMSKYLNEEIIKKAFDINTSFEESQIILNNYEFKTSDFKKINDFRGSGFFIFDGVYYDYLYIICPITHNKENYVCNYAKAPKDLKHFEVIQIDSSDKILNIWEV